MLYLITFLLCLNSIVEFWDRSLTDRVHNKREPRPIIARDSKSITPYRTVITEGKYLQ